MVDLTAKLKMLSMYLFVANAAYSTSDIQETRSMKCLGHGYQASKHS